MKKKSNPLNFKSIPHILIIDNSSAQIVMLHTPLRVSTVKACKYNHISNCIIKQGTMKSKLNGF